MVDPSLIRFTQKQHQIVLQERGWVSELAAGLNGGSMDPADLPAIRLVERNGNYYFSLDNRRRAAFQAARMAIPFRIATPGEIATEAARKFSTKNDGVSIVIRGGNQ